MRQAFHASLVTGSGSREDIIIVVQVQLPHAWDLLPLCLREYAVLGGLRDSGSAAPGDTSKFLPAICGMQQTHTSCECPSEMSYSKRLHPEMWNSSSDLGELHNAVLERSLAFVNGEMSILVLGVDER